MKKTFIFYFAIAIIILMITMPVKIYALDYIISFTGTGASTSLDSVVVQNLTKGSTVTITNGILNLSDGITSISNPSAKVDGISIYPNPVQEKSIVSFYAKEAGSTQIDVFCLDGRILIGVNKTLLQGNNSFQLSIPQGTYGLQIKGNGFTYNTKVISQINCQIKPEISFLGNNNQSIDKPLKSKNTVPKMLYNDGDQLLYKGISGNYSTIVTDVPTDSKTTNFNFIACQDGDGNNYSVVTIGTQTWMAENLKSTKYNDGTTIRVVTDPNVWKSLTIGAYCWYNNSLTYRNTYGALYNWFAVIPTTSKLAPIGWHIAGEDEWTTLINFLGGESIAGGSLKKTGTTYWSVQNIAATNRSGFSALPGGRRQDLDGLFTSIGTNGDWWSSTMIDTISAWKIGLGTYGGDLFNFGIGKNYGLSVRCIKN